MKAFEKDSENIIIIIKWIKQFNHVYTTWTIGWTDSIMYKPLDQFVTQLEQLLSSLGVQINYFQVVDSKI